MPLHLDRLDDAALEAASSRGLLRRARADLKSGAARLIRLEDEEAQVELPDAQVTLRAGGLAAARCSCPAGDICRHILTAILLLRAAGPTAASQPRQTPQESPEADPVAEILALSAAELKKAFGPAVLARAAGALPAPETVVITRAGAACVVVMEGGPEVRYVAGLGIPGMLVKASKDVSRQLCAKALLAVRRAHERSLPLADPLATPVAEGAAQQATADTGVEAVLTSANALVIEWARSGLAAAPEALEERLFEAAISARAAGLFRLGSGLRRLSQDVRRRRGRTSDLDPLLSLRAASRSFALIEALRRQPQHPELRGRARDRFEPLGAVKLIGCGYEIWRTPAGARGVTGHFYAPDRRCWLSAQLARGAGQDASFVAEEAAQRDAVWGVTLERLCESEVRLTNAAVSALGRLSLGRGTRAQLLPLNVQRHDVSSWEGSFADWSVLDAFVRARFGPGLRGVHRGAEVAAVLPAKIGQPAWDEIAQELVLPVHDRQGRALLLRLANQPHLEARILTLLETLAAKRPEVFFVSVALAGERLYVSPYAVLMEGGGTPRPLDARRVLDPWDPVTQQLSGALGQLEARPPPSRAPSATLRLLAAALDVLLGLCELGGRMQDPALLKKLNSLAQRLEESGLAPPARLLAAVAAAPERQRPQALLKAAHSLHGLLELLRLPVT